MQKILIIVHAPPYGSERVLSALRLATALASQEEERVDLSIYMMSDAVTVGLPNQPPADAGFAAALDDELQRISQFLGLA